MDKPEILEIIIQQLPVRTQLSCTLVSRQWYAIAHALIQRYHLARFEDQLDTLRCFTLNRSTTSPTSTYFHSLHLLSNLVSLTISPDARISPDEFNKRTAQYDPNQFCLTTLLPKLDNLRHLYIHGQDLRFRNYGRDTASQLGGLDSALLAFAASRQLKNLPGLQTLSIISSPDLTDEGLIGYLSTPQEGEVSAIGKCSHKGQYTLGNSLLSLTLVNSPLLTVESLLALEAHCPNLQQLTLREVDGLLKSTPQPDSASPTMVLIDTCEVFNRFIGKNASLHTFTFASNLSTLPHNLFKAFNNPHSALQNLHIHPTKGLRSHHLKHFPSIYRLSITVCPKLTDDLPLECMPRLQEISFLGRGLSLSSMWKLFKSDSIRKITLDVAGSAYETCICSENDHPKEADSTADSCSHDECESYGNYERPFPHLLENFKNHNILSASIPSWVVAFFLSYAPPSLDTLSLHGTIMPTCCSVRPSPPQTLSSSNTFQPIVRSHMPYSFTYWNLLLPGRLQGLFGNVMPKCIPEMFQSVSTALFAWRRDSTTKSAEGRSVGDLARLSFEALREAVAGSTGTSGVPYTDDGTSEDKSDVESVYSEWSFNSDIDADAAGTMLGVESESGLPRRRRRAQSISGTPSRKNKVARTSLKRSSSEFVTSRRPNTREPSPHESLKHTVDRSIRESCGATLVENKVDITMAMPISSSSIPSTSNSSPDASENTTLPVPNAREASLAELLAISAAVDVSPSNGISQSTSAGTSRLNPLQLEWLRTSIGDRVTRLEV